MNDKYIIISKIAEIKRLTSIRSFRIGINKGKYIAREIKVNADQFMRKNYDKWILAREGEKALRDKVLPNFKDHSKPLEDDFEK